MMNSGKTIELKKSGTFEVAKLASEVLAQNSTLGKKYVDYMGKREKQSR